MKKILFLLLFLSAVVVHGQTFGTFKKVIHSADSIALIKAERFYWTDEWMCAANIWLRADSTFYKEGGCENHRDISYGKWSQEGDSITLSFLPSEEFNLFYAMSTKGTAKDTLTVQVFDRSGNPIQGSVTGLWISAIGKQQTFHYTDSLGIIRVPLKRVDSLEVKNISEKRKGSVFLAKNLPAQIVLYLNVNETVPMCEYMDAPLIYLYTDKKYKFKKTRVSLISDRQVWDKWTH